MGHLEQLIDGGVFKFYKVRNKRTGEFSSPSGWNQKGKVWGNLGHAKNHIRIKVPKYRCEHAGTQERCREYLNNIEILEITVNIQTDHVNVISIDTEKVLKGGSL